VDPSFTIKTVNLSSTLVTVYGDMFHYRTLNGLYLSSSNVSISSQELNLYTDIKSISAKYPKISAFPVNNFDVIGENTIQFILPNDLKEGNYDIIYMNDAGYYKASDDDRFTFFKVIST
jgi:hypothetical protein